MGCDISLLRLLSNRVGTFRQIDLTTGPFCGAFGHPGLDPFVVIGVFHHLFQQPFCPCSKALASGVPATGRKVRKMSTALTGTK